MDVFGVNPRARAGCSDQDICIPSPRCCLASSHIYRICCQPRFIGTQHGSTSTHSASNSSSWTSSKSTSMMDQAGEAVLQAHVCTCYRPCQYGVNRIRSEGNSLVIMLTEWLRGQTGAIAKALLHELVVDKYELVGKGVLFRRGETWQSPWTPTICFVALSQSGTSSVGRWIV